MTDTTLHTELEVLLFFQSLRVFGVESSAFTKISELLEDNEFVHEDDTYDPNRLSPDSLKELYLRLLKEELRHQGAKFDENSSDKDSDQNSRKRKLSTPPLPSTDEPAGHRHFLPQLVNRLYARYRDHTIRAIQEEEVRYKSLQKDIYEIEEGKWDAQLEKQQSSSRRDSKGVSSIQTLLRHDSGEVQGTRSDQRNEATAVHVMEAAAITAPTKSPPIYGISGANAAEELRFQQLEVVTVAGLPQSHQSPKVPESGSHLKGGLSLSVSQQVPVTHSETSRSSSRPPSQSHMVDSHTPFLPPLSSHGYSMASPNTEGHRRLPHQQSQMGAHQNASPGLSQVPLIPTDRSSASPIILPPPKGMLRSSGSPTGPLDALADMAGQQYRANPSMPSQLQGQIPTQQHHPNHLPQPRNYGQHAYPYYESQPAYSAPYPQYTQHPLQPFPSPSQGNIVPYQSPGQGFAQSPRHSSLPHYQSPLLPYAHYQGYTPNPNSYQHNPQFQKLSPSQPFRPPVPSTPMDSISSKRHPPRPSPIDTSASFTKWKNIGHSHPGRPPGSPLQPGPEELSPISPRVPSSLPTTFQAQTKLLKEQKPEQLATPEKPEGQEDILSHTRRTLRSTRGGRSRANISKSRGARAPSITSSAIDGSTRTRTRSQSTISHADELSMDLPLQSSRKIKPEPPTTPAAADDNMSVASTPLGESSRRSTRRRRDTMRSVESLDTARPSNKRKRPPEATPDLATPLGTPKRIGEFNHILASRNFPRISDTIMNNIAAHKLAGMFAKPVTHRGAPGYKDLIYRPQDLKSIRSAILAGSRAIAAAVESTSMGDVASPAPNGGGGSSSNKNAGSIWVPISEDVVPPKGIVNSAQLEREICRMFANAAMFNPDPQRGHGPAFKTRSEPQGRKVHDNADDGDGLDDGSGAVRDTREMFKDVDKSVADWRAAERAVEDIGTGRGKLRDTDDTLEEDEVDELAGEGVVDSDKVEEGISLPAKRKRKGTLL
ncbi:hypothetical protein MMC06_000620 [Schaereria dolodes]|nr:hypothetical protein [Schaereria dolodes]